MNIIWLTVCLLSNIHNYVNLYTAAKSKVTRCCSLNQTNVSRV